MVSSLMQDVRYALRQLRRSPGFAVAVVGVLALGIGANAAMFTILNGTLLRQLPYRNAGDLVTLTALNAMGNGVPNVLPDIEQWRARSRTLEGIGYYQPQLSYLRTNAEEQEVAGANISQNVFDVLGVAPALGRGFTAEEQQPGKGNVVVLSDAVWRNQFGAAKNAIGRVVRLDGEPNTVIGVMPPGFAFPADAKTAQVWLPVPLGDKTKTRDYTATSFNVIARRRAGAGVVQVTDELTALQKQMLPLYTDRWAGQLAPSHVRVANYRQSLVANQRSALLALLAAVVVVWLIACANVANLMLARSAARRREMAVRGALGASSWRLVQHLLVESLLLSLTGAVLGIVLARGTLALFRHALATEFSAALSLQPDARILGALLALSVVSALLVGVAPALLTARRPLDQSLRQDGVQTGTGRGQQRAQRALVVVEIGLSLAMLVACGLLLRTVFALRHAPLGFRTDHVYVVQPNLPGYKYRSLDPNQSVYKPLLDRVLRMHGVEAAAITTVAPLDTSFTPKMNLGLTAANGSKIDRQFVAQMKASGPELQKVLGFPMVRGRFFNEQDTANSPLVAVVNSAFAKLYEQGAQKSVSDFSLSMSKDRRFKIVGVIDDYHQAGIAASPAPEVDFDAAQLIPTDGFYQATMGAHAELIIRTRADARSFMPDLQRVMHDASPDLSAVDVRTMGQVVEDSMGSQLLAAHLLEALGVLALIVALAGLYSLLAYLVALRTRELGLRMALGAQREQILALVMRQAAWMLAGGIALGIAASLATSQLLSHFLFGVKTKDAATIGCAVALMMAVGAVAAYLPARRASRIEPMDALRTE